MAIIADTVQDIWKKSTDIERKVHFLPEFEQVNYLALWFMLERRNKGWK